MGFNNCGRCTQQLRLPDSSAGSIVVVHGLTCSVACGNLPRPGIELMSPALADGFFSTELPGKPQMMFSNYMEDF